MLEALSLDFVQRALLAGLLVSVAAGIIGALVNVNRMVFAVGGIAHAAYGGVGLGYFFGFSPVIGAVGFGMGAGAAVALVQIRLHERRETVIGALWAMGMSTGILLTDLTPGYKADLMSYLFGSLMTVSRDDLLFMIGVDTVTVFFTVLFYQRIAAVSFDPVFARVRNIPVGLIVALLYLFCAAAVTAMMRLTGLVLVMALLTLPAATAGLFARRLPALMLLSGGLSFVFVSSGLLLSYAFNLTAGASAVLAAALFYLLARVVVFWKSRPQSEAGS